MAEQANIENLDYGNRELPIEKVRSADGTTIAYEKSGSGPPVIIIGGGLNEKAMHAELAEGLSESFTVYNYDRRARGDSDDNRVGPYTVDIEIEDLAAVIEAAGGTASVFANCTGSMIAVPAAARGVPMTKLAMYEPPYSGPKVPPGYTEQLRELLEQDRIKDAVSLFLKWDALFTEDEIEFFSTHPIWPAFEAMAHSMPYDSILSDDADCVPVEELGAITVPSLVLGGNKSPQWMKEMCQAVADGIPRGEYVTMDTAGHLMDDTLGAELLTKFFR
ncbi:alpha/beta hydrolase [Amycolatopsis sp. NPDC051071]|uniref:alpha/beta fold hydrolase n=1 Tax=Amycolatopsis sp. NPDC051071 TaxID=3154637 RepID=UPI003448CC6C